MHSNKCFSTYEFKRAKQSKCDSNRDVNRFYWLKIKIDQFVKLQVYRKADGKFIQILNSKIKIPITERAAKLISSINLS